MIRFFLSLFIVSLFAGCGYKPTTQYIGDRLDNLFVQVDLNIHYPKNYFVIKDEMTHLLIKKFRANLTSDAKQADHTLKITLQDVSFKPIEFQKGFVTKYRTTVNYLFEWRSKNSLSFSKSIKNDYDFKSRPTNLYTLLLEDQKNRAVNNASIIALEKFIATLIYKYANAK